MENFISRQRRPPKHKNLFKSSILYSKSNTLFIENDSGCWLDFLFKFRGTTKNAKILALEENTNLCILHCYDKRNYICGIALKSLNLILCTLRNDILFTRFTFYIRMSYLFESLFNITIIKPNKISRQKVMLIVLDRHANIIRLKNKENKETNKYYSIMWCIIVTVMLNLVW